MNEKHYLRAAISSLGAICTGIVGSACAICLAPNLLVVPMTASVLGIAMTGLFMGFVSDAADTPAAPQTRIRA